MENILPSAEATNGEEQTLSPITQCVVITVRGGMVQEVRSSIKDTEILIADYDATSDEERQLTYEAEKRSTMPDMHIVY